MFWQTLSQRDDWLQVDADLYDPNTVKRHFFQFHGFSQKFSTLESNMCQLCQLQQLEHFHLCSTDDFLVCL